MCTPIRLKHCFAPLGAYGLLVLAKYRRKAASVIKIVHTHTIIQTHTKATIIILSQYSLRCHSKYTVVSSGFYITHAHAHAYAHAHTHYYNYIRTCTMYIYN